MIMLSMSLDSILVPSVVNISVSFTELYPIFIVSVLYLFTNKINYGNLVVSFILLLYQILFVSVFLLVSYSIYLPIVLCCGTK